jgi:hypothetical protein
MLSTDWKPWSFFLTLDYFSRIYFAGTLCTVIRGCTIFVQLTARIRSGKQKTGNFSEIEYLNLARMQRNLHSIESFAMVLTSGCCMNQIFGVWFTYMARVTDANPFFALKDAWIVSQILLCLLILLDSLRRYSFSALERIRLNATS